MGVIKTSLNKEKLFRTIKNALSHMYIEPINSNGKIIGILFKDKEDRNATEYHTILEFTTEQLREFTLFVANKHLKRMSN